MNEMSFCNAAVCPEEEVNENVSNYHYSEPVLVDNENMYSLFYENDISSVDDADLNDLKDSGC